MNSAVIAAIRTPVRTRLNIGGSHPSRQGFRSPDKMGTCRGPHKAPSMSDPTIDPIPPKKPLTEAAARALAEAAARRRALDEKAAAPPEKGGRGGLDPARYGDWEIKGLTSDF